MIYDISDICCMIYDTIWYDMIWPQTTSLVLRTFHQHPQLRSLRSPCNLGPTTVTVVMMVDSIDNIYDGRNNKQGFNYIYIWNALSPNRGCLPRFICRQIQAMIKHEWHVCIITLTSQTLELTQLILFLLQSQISWSHFYWPIVTLTFPSCWIFVPACNDATMRCSGTSRPVCSARTLMRWRMACSEALM